MGDFLIDFRPPDQRQLARAAELLRFFPDMRTQIMDAPEFGLVLSSSDDLQLWGSYESPDRSTFAAVVGRIAVDAQEWARAKQLPGDGGLAGKVICRRYRDQGLAGLQGLSGNFVVLVHDRALRTWFLLTDPWGLVPAFALRNGRTDLVYASHPDVLAAVTGEERNYDLTSFAEFILAARLTTPHSYYRRIQALPAATRLDIALGRAQQGEASTERRQAYLSLTPAPESEERLEDLAEAFAQALRRAVARRTQPLLGRSAIALSGGLDSRTVLWASGREDVFAFSCYDTENEEFLIAQAIARETRVKFVPLRRPPEYYAEHAPLGVRISAGMGCIASNHFLGVREQLRELGADNLLTGCYCDYLYKGLALNKQVNRLTTQERLGPFNYSFYAAHFPAATGLARSVQERLAALYPEPLPRYDSPDKILAVEQRRLFPLFYEEDNTERVIPQRVMGWYVPIADQELLRVYLRQSCRMRLNRRLFIAMVQRVCGPRLCCIPDANTGVPVDASPWTEALACHTRRVRRLWSRLHSAAASQGSWLHWPHYVRHSQKLRALWERPNPDATDVFCQVLGPGNFKRNIADYAGRDIWLFLQLFTLKLWFDQQA